MDTADSSLTTGASSMSYSPSQLDVGGDVDPVAEADVYLAYGRDLQAEEILKEAMRHNPERVAIPVKLAEIYAKRQDRKALESAASDVFRLTDGQGPDLGQQYLSKIFYADDAQKQTAQELIDILKSKGIKVATELLPLGVFWPAEDYHQNYYNHKGTVPYCHAYTKRF